MNNNKQEALAEIAKLKEQIQKIEDSLKEPQYKVGDWVYIHDGNCGIKVGTVGKLNRYDGHDWKLDAGYANVKRFRLATPEEIAAAQVKTVVIGIDTKITIEKGKISADDGRKVTISAVENLISILKSVSIAGNIPWSLSNVTIDIGCAKSVKIGQLEQVINEYQKINN